MTTPTTPLLAIKCITYNHEPFIRQALDGFVMQKTSFPFIAIVHDDASTDGTADIIREYAEKYPDIIKPIYETENQYSKHDGSLRRIMNDALIKSGVKYVAMCEGDDYWTNPNKLQKQVDFLEAHPEYSLCFHNVKTLMLDGSWKTDLFNIHGSGEYSPSEILAKWTIPTCSTVYVTKGIVNNIDRLYHPKFKYGDSILWLTAATQGKLYCMDEAMSVYRRNGGGVTVSTHYEKWREITIEHTKGINDVFSDILEPNLCEKLISEDYIYLIRRFRNKPIKVIKYFFKGVKDAKLHFLKMCYNSFILHQD